MSSNTTYNNKLQVFQGNNKDISVVVYDASNNLYDLSGYNAFFYAQKYPIRESNPIDVSLSANSLDASGNILFIISKGSLNKTPGDYVYEIIIDDGSTNRITVIQDRLNIINSIV